ncbi:sensor domain-containing protein [Microbacteriaceae bacterium VKM Ac-2855]|nr:sensor domain-containing protein [Microbacteriaceae bacterium VKM Ac-2855]
MATEARRPRGAWDYYLGLWRTAPRELLSQLALLPLSVGGFLVTLVVVLAAVGLISVLVGVLLIPVALHLARALGDLERKRVALSGRPPIAAPNPRRSGATPSGGAVLYAPVLDGHYWLALLHVLVVGPFVGVGGFVIVAVWFWAGFGTLLAGLIDLATGDASTLRAPAEWFVDAVYGLVSAGVTPEPLIVAASITATVMFIATLPFVTRGLAIVTALIDRGLLGPWRSERLQVEVADLSASRGAAVVAEDRALRRLERDIHDGPQQRLIRVQMDLAAAERRVDADPDAAKRMLAEAREHVRAALDELRALSRGVAPPILQDRGLVAAVHSLAAVSPVPVAVEADSDGWPALPSEVERSAYFIVAELLTNVAKHAGAGSARIHLGIRQPEADGFAWLDVWVIDDGRGGITAVPGHGIDGLDGRVRGLRGLLVVDSPPGGPSVVGVHVPFAVTAAGAR